jgi:type 1 glutamine amidotransferase
MLIRSWAAVGLGAWALASGAAEPKAVVKPEEVTKITQAMPETAPAKPQKSRKLLVFTLTRGFPHSSVPVAAKAFEIMGQKTGAFEAVVSDDIAMFEPETLRQFDAVLMDNTTGDLFAVDTKNLTQEEQKAAKDRSARLRRSLLEFVNGGKGIAGVHAATDCFYNWKEYGEMMGGYFNGHPFSDIVVKNDDPKSPVNAAFQGEGFANRDEMYTFREPYSREKLHILLSIDMDKTKLADDPAKPGFKKGENRPDHDYAISWIKAQGRGRVFYCSFGHEHNIFWKTHILQHYLAGIQYVLGDLQADATPSAQPKQ